MQTAELVIAGEASKAVTQEIYRMLHPQSERARLEEYYPTIKDIRMTLATAELRSQYKSIVKNPDLGTFSAREMVLLAARREHIQYAHVCPPLDEAVVSFRKVTLWAAAQQEWRELMNDFAHVFPDPAAAASSVTKEQGDQAKTKKPKTGGAAQE